MNGVGAVDKRADDDAVKQEKTVIQNAQDFFNWANDIQSAISYVFVGKQDCQLVKKGTSSCASRTD